MPLTRSAAARWQLALLIGVVVVGGVLRFSELGSQSYWFDESVTAGLLGSSLSDVFSSLSESESTPPLYYVVAWVWTQVFGAGEAGLRSLSALAGVGVIPLVWACGRELLSSRAGLAAATLVAINPMLIWYSQEARAYSLLTLLVAASFWFFLRARRAPTINWLLAWGVASALAVATHYFAIFVLLPQAAWLLWELRAQRRSVIAACGLIAVAGLALLPLARQQEADGRTAWISAADPLDRLWEVLRELFSANTALVSSASNAPGGPWWLLGLLGVVGALLIGGRATRVDRRAALPAAAIGVAAIALPLVLALTPIDFFKDRNLIAAWIPLAVGLGVVLAGARSQRLAFAALSLIVIAGVAVTATVRADPDKQRTDWRSVTAALGKPHVARAVIIRPGYARSLLAVYGHYVSPMPVGARVREVAVIGSGVLAPGVRPPALPGFRLVEQRVVGDVAVLRYQRTHGGVSYTQATLAGSPDPVLLEPSLAARGWLERYTRLHASLLTDMQRASEDAGARRRLLEAPEAVRRLGPPPEEIPVTAGLLARLREAASRANEFARDPSPRLKERLGAALRPSR